MKSEKEIEAKIKNLVEYLKKRFVGKKTSRRFFNCKHNNSCHAQYIHGFNYCTLKSIFSEKSIQKLFVCESDDWAHKCRDFALPEDQEESSTQEFYDIINDQTSCMRTFPQLAFLLWTLQDD